MKLSIDFGRWTTTKAALAVAGLLVMAGVVGSALAVSPTVAPAIKWAGGVATMSAGTSGGGAELYTVPAGRNFMLTDLAVSNLTSSAARFALIGAAPEASCAGGTAAQTFYRMQSVVVSPDSTLVIPLVTGFGFTAGQHVCIATSAPYHIQANARGFLFTSN